jgi:hypothetical protein
MQIHEVASVLVASLVALVVVRAFMPGSNAAAVINALGSSWSNVLNAVGGSSAPAARPA